jgi:hypothetical protein
MKKQSEKQRAALAKGRKLMQEANALQKKNGTKTVMVTSGGKFQKVEVYRTSMKDALKTVARRK